MYHIADDTFNREDVSMMRRSMFGGKRAGVLAGLLLGVLLLPAAAAGDAGSKARGASGVAGEPHSAVYWFQRGALCSTYGNNKAAVSHFGRAVALDPRHSGAHFSRGVSYGQLGMYAQGIASIDRALELEPGNGLYYYGRGRVYLLSGDREKAMQDFRKAAQLGDEDAQAYLKKAR
jgi:tetratricopeptide (TPR) repeat protein